ncbi:MAG TPA: hypothetical protein VMW83_13140 [Spirochaetia bacterium]|nr:hypothetical protein [Spirochaetia bacterium]
MKEKTLSLARDTDVLILDRYCPSGWVYGMALRLEQQWRNLDAGLPQAHLTILLDLTLASARKRAAGKDVLERDPVSQGGSCLPHLAAEGGSAVVDVQGGGGRGI